MEDLSFWLEDAVKVVNGKGFKAPSPRTSTFIVLTELAEVVYPNQIKSLTSCGHAAIGVHMC